MLKLANVIVVNSTWIFNYFNSEASKCSTGSKLPYMTGDIQKQNETYLLY